jgi:valyl-tRNA synthetase
VPFVTEEIWEKLPGTQDSIMKAAYPEPQNNVADTETLEKAQADMSFVMGIITGIRNIRGEMNIAPSAKLDAAVASSRASVRQTVESHQGLIAHLARLNELQVVEHENHSNTAATAIVSDATLLVELKGVVDFARETKRLEKEIGKLSKELSGINTKLSNDGFLAKAPEKVVAQVRSKQALLSEKRDKLESTLAKVKSFVTP